MDATDQGSLDRLSRIGQNLYRQKVDLLMPFIENKVEQYTHHIKL